MSPEAVSAKGRFEVRRFHLWCLASHQLGKLRERNQGMIKTLDAIAEVIRNPKHPFRRVENRPAKPQKHRYERRKIKEYIRLGDWAGENAS
jgi:hypothetical protein